MDVYIRNIYIANLENILTGGTNRVTPTDFQNLYSKPLKFGTEIPKEFETMLLMTREHDIFEGVWR